MIHCRYKRVQYANTSSDFSLGKAWFLLQMLQQFDDLFCYSSLPPLFRKTKMISLSYKYLPLLQRIRSNRYRLCLPEVLFKNQTTNYRGASVPYTFGARHVGQFRREGALVVATI